MSDNSAMSAEKLHEEANELLLNDQFEKALALFSSSIEKSDKSNSTLLFNNYIRRSDVNVKLKHFKEAVEDAESAIQINDQDSRGFLKKGNALLNLKNYQNALAVLEEGFKVATTQGESDVKRQTVEELIKKCKEKIPPNQIQTPKDPKDSGNQSSVSVEIKAANVAPQIKYEWYQTESQVTVSVLAKNVNANDVTIETTSDNLSIKSKNTENFNANFNINLANQIAPEQTQIKYLMNKIEIKLRKLEGVQWKKLESDPNEKIINTAKIPTYPTSSKKPKNWDQIAAEVTAEEKDEKLEGDSALNKLFQQVYQNGTEETRRAMNKSFTESGGTVLSTNWSEVGAKKLEVKAPDGMEFKKWDE